MSSSTPASRQQFDWCGREEQCGSASHAATGTDADLTRRAGGGSAVSIYQAHELEMALAGESAAWRLTRALLPHDDPDTVDLTSLAPAQIAAVEALHAARAQRRRLLAHLVPPQA